MPGREVSRSTMSALPNAHSWHRDYYPWWHPSPWIDIAVLTNDARNKSCTDPTQGVCTARCEYYLKNSFNKNPKGYCEYFWSIPDSVSANDVFVR